MKIRIIALALLCMLMLVGCSNNSSSKKGDSSETTTTTTTTHKNLSFEATALMVSDDGHIGMIESDYVIDDANGEIGVARLDYDDDNVKVSSDVKEGDRIRITVWGSGISMRESYPPILFEIKSIEKIN